MRLERDSLGAKRLPDNAYYGIQTQRAVENFPISGLHLPHQMVRSMAEVKRAAALANRRVGWLSARRSRAIVRACDELLAGRFRDQFVVDAFQAGAGTSFHMNVNEVLANRAAELLGGKKGDVKRVHPNDHVNMAQSTNDVFPTTMRLAALALLPDLSASLTLLERALARKGVQYRRVVKSARTHLQDAVPTFLGETFTAYAITVRKAHERIREQAARLQELNLGGTAAGTGLNAHPRYRVLAIRELNRRLHMTLRPAGHLPQIMQSLGDFVGVSGALRGLAIELIRLANDLRLMSSGPNTGLAEIELPAVQPGSSIMPGKVNPVMPEVTDMVSFQVIGNDTVITLAAQAGQCELNVMMPIVAHNLLQSLHVLSTVTHQLATRCIPGITADAARCRVHAERSIAIATALNPHIGYQAAAQVAKEAMRRRALIRDVVVERGLLTAADARRILDPARLARGSHAPVPRSSHRR